MLKAVDIFITHDGLNSVTEALYYGVPMIVIPFMTDQSTNAAQIEKLALGLRLNYKGFSSELLRKTILSVLNNQTILQNISDMQKKMQTVNSNQYGSKLIMKFCETFYNNKMS